MKQVKHGHDNGKGTATQDVSFRKQGMSTEEISSFCFPHNAVSTCSGTLIDQDEMEASPSPFSGGDSSDMGMTSSPCMELQFGLSNQLNTKFLAHQNSREGRSSQRWSWTTPRSNEPPTPVRLTTGCVPICQNGKILLVSASKKAEWIIPKGGWETDESMEESALRETWEEAGVMGIIASRPFASVEVETRKARKRRLENREQTTKITTTNTTVESTNGSECEHTKLPSRSNKVVTPENSCRKLMDKIDSCSDQVQSLVVSSQVLERMGDLKRKLMDDACSSVSSSSSTDHNNYSQQYTHVRLAMFPLYVTKVLDSWPEDGRIRKIVDIDEAIQILQNRPELQAMVLKVKEQNLHRRRPVVTA